MAVSLPPGGPSAIGDIRSELGALRSVLVHRPGDELDCVTRANADRLLFDAEVRAEPARREHDALVGTLAAAGAEVVYVADLLAGALRDPEAHRRGVLLAAAGAREPVRGGLLAWLRDLSPESLASVLIGGATLDEVGLPGRASGTSRRGEFAVPPLPNQMFVRDTSAWIGDQLVLGATANPVRRRESTILAIAYEHHPALARAGRPARPRGFGRIEGGDLFCLGEATTLVGIGARTDAAAAERLAAHLFESGFERVLVVQVPPRRASIHLDCLMTVVDHDVLLIDRRLAGAPTIEMRPPGAAVASRIHLSLPAALGDALGVEFRRVEVADESEQWTLAANTLALAPGRVIAYDINPRTNEALAAAGVEVTTVPGTELSRGHGGPRCLTSPLVRDRLPGSRPQPPFYNG